MTNMIELDSVSVSEPLDNINFLPCVLVCRVEESLDHKIIQSALGFKDFGLGTTASLFPSLMLSV